MAVDVPVQMLITDRRIVFVTKGGDADTDAGELSYSDLAGIDTADPLRLTTTEGVAWEFSVTDGTSIDSAHRHLSWVGELRSRVIGCRNDVDLAAGEIRSQADSLNWDAATEAYQEIRERLDDLIVTVQLAERFDEDVLAPELTEIERTLEKAHVRLYIDQAQSQLELGRHLVDNEDYEQAGRVLEQAQEYYQQARNYNESLKRGDSFQFGTQRELETELEDLGWEIETVAAEPIRQAHEVKVLAQNTNEPAKAIEHWETALRRYSNVRTLEWGDDDRSFAGDPERVREEMRTATQNLIDLHEQRARQLWNQGSERENEGQHEHATAQCRAATEHLERAHELAEEFAESRAAAFESRLEKMFETLLEMRDALSEDDTTSEDGDESRTRPSDVPTADGEKTTGNGSTDDRDWPPSVDDLSEIDTHHEITLSVDGVSTQTDDDSDQRSSTGDTESESADETQSRPEDQRQSDTLL